MDITALFHSKIFRGVLWGIGIFTLLLLVFKAGEFVGFRKALFGYRFHERSYRGFGGSGFGGARGDMYRGMMGGFGGRDFMTSHGTSGVVISIADSSFMVQDYDKSEKEIVVAKGTEIREFRTTVPFASMKVGDSVIVIGAPNDIGQIEARFIRIVPNDAGSASPPPTSVL